MDPKIQNVGVQEEDEGLGWGKSLPVPSVQEMVRIDSKSVPEKYIQEFKDRLLDSKLSPLSSNKIPTIDFSLLASGNVAERRKLDSACKNWGFFQMTNHLVTEEVIRNMKTAVAAFFELPLEKKRKYAMAANDVQGYGQGYVVSEHQKLDWGNLLFLMTLPTANRKEAVEQYSMGIEKMTAEILCNLSLLMGMDKETLKGLQGEMKQAMRMNYYPACSRPDLVLGVSPHSDASTITLLLQDEEVTGLQIRHQYGWIPVKPIPNAIVLNIGDVTEVWSNGVYRSIEHRAVTNEKKARLSIATFVFPDDEVEIAPVESMVNINSNHPRLYKKIKYVDYLRYSLQRKMEGKTHTEFLKTESN